MSSKYAIVLLLATFACSVHCIGNNKNVIEFGVKTNTDTLLANQQITAPKSLFNTVTRTYTLTQTIATPLTIRYISITNEKPFRGATAQITAGGINSQTVTITLTSKRSAGIKSTIQIYGN